MNEKKKDMKAHSLSLVQSIRKLPSPLPSPRPSPAGTPVSVSFISPSSHLPPTRPGVCQTSDVVARKSDVAVPDAEALRYLCGWSSLVFRCCYHWRLASAVAADRSAMRPSCWLCADTRLGRVCALLPAGPADCPFHWLSTWPRVLMRARDFARVIAEERSAGDWTGAHDPTTARHCSACRLMRIIEHLCN